MYGYPSVEASEAAVSEVRNFLDEGGAKSLERIVFCNFLAKDEDAYHEVLPKYFPSAVEESEGDVEAKKELEEKLPEVPVETPKEGDNQPVAKKKKLGEEDEEWEKIEKSDVPQKVSVEDAVDEEVGGKSKV